MGKGRWQQLLIRVMGDGKWAIGKKQELRKAGIVTIKIQQCPDAQWSKANTGTRAQGRTVAKWLALGSKQVQ